MKSARLRVVAAAHPERCLSLIQALEEPIERLQEQIDHELKGVLYSLQKSPAPPKKKIFLGPPTWIENKLRGQF